MAEVGLIGAALRATGLDPDVPRWLAVGLRPGELDVSVTLRNAQTAIDVSERCSVASLRPLQFALGVADGEFGGESVLEFREAQGLVLGEIGLRSARRIGPDGAWELCDTISHRNFTVPSALLKFTYARFEFLRLRDSLRNRNDPFSSFGGLPLRASLVFYNRPRPVVLVSVSHAGRSNLFPMDLVGPVPGGRFLMALRSTSPAVLAMSGSRRIAMAEIPPSYKEHAYALAANHKRGGETFLRPPFEAQPSTVWKLLLPSEALRVREVEVEAVEVVGSHHLFTTRIVDEEAVFDGPRLHHIPGLYGHGLKLRGRLLNCP
jgi:flavin reductase (DIM6/NTAB) family NADH-FMN oxidoreductase RutF